MDDIITQGWSLDPELSSSLRLAHLERLVAAQAWPQAILDAEELLDLSPSSVSALEMLAKALLGVGDAEGAVQAWEQIHLLDPTPRADRLTALATARLDTCDLLGAAADAREAVRLDPACAEAWFILGLALENLPDRATEATQALLTAHRLDPVAHPLPVQLDPAGWEQAMTTAMLHVSPEIRDLWEGVRVSLVDQPDLQDLRAHDPPLSPRIPGNFLGSPPDDQDDPWQTRPDGLVLYARNLGRVTSLEELIEVIADVLEHEALVWVGEDPWADPIDPDDAQV